MNFKLFSLLMVALSFSVIVSSCDKDDDEMHNHDNEITINILEPAAGEIISDASHAHVHIEIEATDENHEIEIVLHPENDTNDKIIDHDQHSHDTKIVFEQDVDLSDYPSGTEFHLEVEACVDHDCEEKATEEVSFSIQ